jgi:flagellar protein FliJ
LQRQTLMDRTAACSIKSLEANSKGVANMKSNHPILQATCFAVAERARKVASLKAMVIDFENMASELARQIAAEEQRTGIRSPAHVDYSTLAKAMALRRTNLLESVADLNAKLDIARLELGEVEAELHALEPAETRDTDRQPRMIDRTLTEARHTG